MKRSKNSLIVGVLAVAILTGLGSGAARAANPLFEVDGAEEYNIPVPKPDTGFSVFLQDAYYNTNEEQYTSKTGSDTNSIPVSHTAVGVSRYAYVFSSKALPGVGFWLEGLVPEVTVYGRGFSVTGIGDPLFNFAEFYRPVPNIIIGNQNIVSIPAGSTEVSNHFFTFYPTLFFDATPATGIKWIDRFGFDGVTGAGISSAQHRSGFDTDIGNQYFFQTKIRYELFPWLSPFFAFHYTVTEPGSSFNGTAAAAPSPLSGVNTPAGGYSRVPRSAEVLTGGGVELHVTPVTTVNVWYIKGVEGQNTTQSNAIYMNFVHAWGF